MHVMEHIKMSVVQIYIDHSEPLKDQRLNCQNTPGSVFIGQPRAIGARLLPQLQLVLGHLLYIE